MGWPEACGRDGLQPAVSLVYGFEGGRLGLECEPEITMPADLWSGHRGT
jgi:hypothetical protein